MHSRSMQNFAEYFCFLNLVAKVRSQGGKMKTETRFFFFKCVDKTVISTALFQKAEKRARFCSRSKKLEKLNLELKTKTEHNYKLLLYLFHNNFLCVLECLTKKG